MKNLVVFSDAVSLDALPSTLRHLSDIIILSNGCRKTGEYLIAKNSSGPKGCIKAEALASFLLAPEKVKIEHE